MINKINNADFEMGKEYFCHTVNILYSLQLCPHDMWVNRYPTGRKLLSSSLWGFFLNNLNNGKKSLRYRTESIDTSLLIRYSIKKISGLLSDKWETTAPDPRNMGIVGFAPFTLYLIYHLNSTRVCASTIEVNAVTSVFYLVVLQEAVMPNTQYPLTAEEAAELIFAGILQKGGDFSDWYVNISANPLVDTLNRHNVSINEINVIFCKCRTQLEATKTMEILIISGCDVRSINFIGYPTTPIWAYAFRKDRLSIPSNIEHESLRTENCKEVAFAKI